MSLITESSSQRPLYHILMPTVTASCLCVYWQLHNHAITKYWLAIHQMPAPPLYIIQGSVGGEHTSLAWLPPTHTSKCPYLDMTLLGFPVPVYIRAFTALLYTNYIWPQIVLLQQSVRAGLRPKWVAFLSPTSLVCMHVMCVNEFHPVSLSALFIQVMIAKIIAVFLLLGLLPQGRIFM